jgi:Mg-chelatase subunit ChlI
MKRIALVDNATLTAAQRLLGDIEVKNLYNIDGDIEAFENLAQAILFFDEVCCIDDYKPAFRNSRAHR